LTCVHEGLDKHFRLLEHTTQSSRQDIENEVLRHLRRIALSEHI
jgi:hypothetical protein